MARSPSIRNLQEFLHRFAPPSLAEEWDNVGLQVGDLDEKITGILISLDVTEPVLWEAVEHDANVLITHHPLFFQPISCLDNSTVPTQLARLAVQMDLNILSLHTNLDSTKQGLNDLLAKKLKLTQTLPLIPSRDPKILKAGLGRTGKIKKTTLKKFISQVAKALSLSDLRYVGDPKHPIQKVAVMTGSGGDFFFAAREAGADVLVTGDVKYHQALDALAMGIPIVDIGHYAGEIGMVPLMADKVGAWLRSKKFSSKVFMTQAQSDPFQFWSK